MKYYKTKIKSFYGDRIASDAKGENIANADEYFWAMDKGEILYNVPIFDYFVLESFDKEKYWEWALFDVHDFIGTGSQIPGWFISKKLKKLLELINGILMKKLNMNLKNIGILIMIKMAIICL